jgi:hypothetical protein
VRLFFGLPPLFWLWHWRYQVRTTAALDDLTCRLPVVVEFPMPGGKRVGGIQNGALKELIRQYCHPQAFFTGS